MLLTKTLLVTTVAATAVAGATVLTAGAADAAPAIAGTYNTVSPTRVLDTRAGTGAAKAKVAAGGVVTFNAAATLNTKLVSAEALTVTAVSPVGSGYLVAYPGGTPRPATSTVNFAKGPTAANTAIVPYGSAGSVSIYNGSGHAIDVVADIFGYWTGGSVADDTNGAYNPVASSRLVDTRSPSAPLAPRTALSVAAAGQAGIPETNVGAVVVNIAVPGPKAGGFLTATANPTDESDDTRTSDVSFSAGRSRANLVVVPLDPDTGTFSLRNGATSAVNAVVDVVGYFSGGEASEDGAFVPSSPFRNSDTRKGSAVAARGTTKVPVVPAISPSLFKAVVVTITEVGAPRGGFFTAWSGSGTRPGTSVLNFAAGTTTAATVIVPLNADGSFSVYNGAPGSANVITDVHGFILNDVSGTPAQIRAHVRTALAHARSSAAHRVAS